MKKRKIVRRVYSLMNGVNCNATFYLANPITAWGQEVFHGEIDNAYLFEATDLERYNYKNAEVSGNDRSGDFKYIQEILDVDLFVQDLGKAWECKLLFNKESLTSLLNDFGNSSLRKGKALTNSNQVADEVNSYISETYPNLE